MTEQQLLRMAKRRLAILRHAEEITGNVALYAGQGVGQVTDVTPAGQVVAELAQDTARLLRR